MSAPRPRRPATTLLRTYALACVLAGPATSALSASPGTPDADDALSLSIATDVGEVRSGRAFEFVVTRSWTDDLEPRAWDDEAWRPLFVRSVDGERSRSGDVTREITRYRAWVFGEGELALTPPPLIAVPRAGGVPLRSVAEPVPLTVVPALAEDAAPEPEWPGAVRDGALTTTSLVLRIGAAFALATLVAFVMRVRRRPLHDGPDARPEHETMDEDDTAAPPVSARDEALADLVDLRAHVGEGARTSVEALARDVSGTLRVYLATRYGLATAEHTTPEIVRDLGPHAAADALTSVLRRCDAIKFGRALPDVDARAGLLDDAVAFVRGERA